MIKRARMAVLAVLAMTVGCGSSSQSVSPAPGPAAASVGSIAVAEPGKLVNRIAQIPPQCYTRVASADGGVAKNPCYVCHTRAEAPNYVDDEALQLRWSLPAEARENPWTNLLSPPVLRARATSDDEIVAYVRKSNYFDDRGQIALAARLRDVPAEWDLDHDGRYGGYVPDVWFRFDENGFDLRPDGTKTGWRAFAYYPFPGTFFPTNGSMDDVLIRLDPILQQDDTGANDDAIYALNFAIVESLIKRTDVAIPAADEARLGVDLDLDGKLRTATRVAFDAGGGRGDTRMSYVGRARDQARGFRSFPIAPGLFPLHTEFVHSVRYLDVTADGRVAMAPRMKELRYAKKLRFLDPDALKGRITAETVTPDEGARASSPARERGISNDQGWIYQGFIEDERGDLRPQSLEESVSCVGCHGGIGATTDSNFSFARKLATIPSADGARRLGAWLHGSQRDLRGVPEPRRRDGTYEYTRYLRENGAGDDLRANDEVIHRFFDAEGALLPAAVQKLHGDVSTLLLPSPARALALDKAYKAIVDEQSFVRGRGAVLAPASNVYAHPPIGERTGVRVAVEGR